MFSQKTFEETVTQNDSISFQENLTIEKKIETNKKEKKLSKSIKKQTLLENIKNEKK